MNLFLCFRFGSAALGAGKVLGGYCAVLRVPGCGGFQAFMGGDFAGIAAGNGKDRALVARGTGPAFAQIARIEE